HDRGQKLEGARVEIGWPLADAAQHGVVLAVGAMDLEALGLHCIDHMANLLGCRLRRHHDHHGERMLVEPAPTRKSAVPTGRSCSRADVEPPNCSETNTDPEGLRRVT